MRKGTSSQLQEKSLTFRDCFKRQLNLGDRFTIKSRVINYGNYVMYKGVDLKSIHWVHIYASRVKEQTRSMICPSVIKSGEIQTKNTTYFYQIHQKYGPSLRTMFNTLNRGPTKNELLHLLFELIKLVEKMNAGRVICGQLSPDLIVFDRNPSKNTLFLINSFKLKKKGSCTDGPKNKYCSRGAHLGRGLTIKDDLQSIIYMLIDLFSEGNFLVNKTVSQSQKLKLSTKIEEFGQNLPTTLISFYRYILSLNLNDQIDFLNWKSTLSRELSLETVHSPFKFMQAKSNVKKCFIEEKQNENTSLELSQFELVDQEKEKRVSKIVNYCINSKMSVKKI